MRIIDFGKNKENVNGIISLRKMVIKNSGFSVKVTCGCCATGKRKEILRIKHNLEMKYAESFSIIDNR